MGKALISGFVFIFILNFAGLYFDLFNSSPILDVSLHFLAGILVAAFFFWFFGNQRPIVSSFWIKAFLGLSFVALIGVLWELAEFVFLDELVARIFSLSGGPADRADTMGDLASDLLGATTAILISRIYAVRKSLQLTSK